MKIKHYDVDQCYVNEEYQRDLNMNRVADMVEDFKESLLNPLKVFEMEDGTVEVFDGQHTLELHKQLGRKKVPGIPYNGVLSEVENRAMQFVAANTCQKRLTPLQIFKAELRAGDHRAVTLDKIARSNGYRIGSGSIGAVGHVQRIYRRSDAEGVDTVLGFVRSTWGDADQALHGGLLEALDLVLTDEDRPVDYKKLSKRLSRYMPVEIVRAGRGHGGGGSNALRIANEIYRLYDLRTRKG